MVMPTLIMLLFRLKLVSNQWVSIGNIQDQSNIFKELMKLHLLNPLPILKWA